MYRVEFIRFIIESAGKQGKTIGRPRKNKLNGKPMDIMVFNLSE